jgi:2-oxoglutarate dehydrogenase E1 component
VLPHVDTGVARPVLDRVFDALTAYPAGFAPHPKLARQFEQRAKLYREQGEVEWSTAEALAFGSLVLEGTDVRLAGEDSQRGTFSQRHAALVDYDNGETWIPLTSLGAAGRFMVYDSLLSEYAAVGFEYGYSVADPDALVLWEAQFGDFVNGAQIIIDQFLTAAEDKWGQTSGLTLLLPHGYEGQGPEHSSARIERFLTLCAEDNIQVANATTAAQYFHLLRRQCVRDVRKPLVVLAPKQPLRMKESRSRVADLTQGSFRETLDDPGVGSPEAVTRVVLCSGKVAWDLLAERDRLGTPVAVVRVEQLYPWPEAQIEAILAGYPGTTEVVWAQEEPENMGPWPFVFHQLHPVANRYRLRVAARVASGSPATGSATIHKQELQDLLAEAVGPA